MSVVTDIDPVIFDDIKNIENHFSIGSFDQEMQVAVSYYRVNGKEAEIVNDRFRVIDDVRETRELFTQLNDTLSASWETM